MTLDDGAAALDRRVVLLIFDNGPDGLAEVAISILL